MCSKHLLATFSLGSAALASISGQLPINTSERELNLQALDSTTPYSDNASPFNSDSEQWDFDQGPSKNATWNLVFDTVHSLLQFWPNTRYRHGHNIVPGVIPTGTSLHHGTLLDTIPTGPDWTATDPEHSILFCRTLKGGGWHLTLAVTRPLKVLYFDGSSAAKITEGTMDTQDIVTWGEPRPERVHDELERIKDLCAWGKEFKIDAFVRMQWNFEVMLCDFTAGVKVVSFLHVVTPEEGLISSGSPQPNSDVWIRIFEAIHSGSWHNHYPGDSRIILDLTGLVSLYDTALVPSLIDIRVDLERCDHRVLGVSSRDISRMMKRLTEIVSRPDPVVSSIDWKALIHVVVDRYADRLELVQHLLNFTTSDSQELFQRAKLVQAQLRVILTPYLLHSTVVPTAVTSGLNASRWAYPIFKQCATTQTSEMISQIPFMTSSEHLLANAVQEVTREICRVTTKMWSVGVLSGLDTLFKIEPNGEVDVTRLMGVWRNETQELTSWLDWSFWVKCRPACGPEEICHLPTWPVNVPPAASPGGIERLEHVPGMEYFTDAHSRQFPHPETPENWRKPQPKCIRRFQPYGF